MAGGIESQLAALVLGLDRTTFQPVVLSLYGPRARDLHFAPALRAAEVPLVLPDLGWGVADKAHGVMAIVRAARTLVPDLIQAEGYHANLLSRLAWPLLPRRVRLVGTLRGTHTAKQMRYEQLSHWMCSRIVTNAPQLQDDLIRRGHVPERRVVCIPNGIALDRFARPRDAGLREKLAPGATFVLACIGRISFEKNVHWIVQALGILVHEGRLPSSMRFLIVGAVQDAAAQIALDAAIVESGLVGVVSQHPATEHPEDVYHASDATILFSPNEGLPSVVIESLAAGRPVIISAAANAAGMIEDGHTGWVVPTQDLPRLAETLAQVMALPATTLRRMGAACRARAEDFSVDRLVRRYGDLYEALARETTR
jgi:glycosyltransferase involved in cell wall biosynthesis